MEAGHGCVRRVVMTESWISVFYFKNVIAFFTIFGWSGLTCLGTTGLSNTVTIIVSVLFLD